MATALPCGSPTETLERANYVARAKERDSGHLHGNFNFARGDGQGHSEFGPDGEAFPDRIGDVRLSLGLRRPLANTARDGRALRDIHSVFIAIEAHDKFHSGFILP